MNNPHIVASKGGTTIFLRKVSAGMWIATLEIDMFPRTIRNIAIDDTDVRDLLDQWEISNSITIIRNDIHE